MEYIGDCHLIFARAPKLITVSIIDELRSKLSANNQKCKKD